MKFAEGRFIYQTYIVYNYIDYLNQELNYKYDEELNEIKTLQFKMYPEYEDLIEVIYKDQKGWEIQKLNYKSHMLFYLSKYNNTFLVNVILNNEDYPKDLNIVDYNMGNRTNLIKEINVNSINYKCLNVGKAFIEFQDQNFENKELRKDTNILFWKQFERYLKRETDEHKFRYEKFDNYMIVYKYDKIGDTK